MRGLRSSTWRYVDAFLHACTCGGPAWAPPGSHVCSVPAVGRFYNYTQHSSNGSHRLCWCCPVGWEHCSQPAALALGLQELLARCIIPSRLSCLVIWMSILYLCHGISAPNGFHGCFDRSLTFSSFYLAQWIRPFSSPIPPPYVVN